MNKMLDEMIANYKALVDSYKKDFERGCFKDFKEYKDTLEEEYKTMMDILYGLLRYEVVTKDVYHEVAGECFEYAMRATF